MATRRTKPELEGAIEDRFVKGAKKLGCMTRKLNGMGFSSWPDRMVLCPGGAVVLIEFKRPGQGLREAQADLHESAKAIGHTWFVCTDSGSALEIVCNHIK